MRQLIADKEDTAQVFRIVKALSGNSYYRNSRICSFSNSLGINLRIRDYD